MIKILHKDKNLVAICKPAGMPSQSDTTGDADAMSATASELSLLGEDSGLWLVHRLDRVVGGILVFARSKSSAAALSELVGGHGMQKEYLAVVEGNAPGGCLVDYLYKDARAGKAFAVKEGKRGAKRAELEYFPIATEKTERGVYTLVRVKLHTGRFHQIRAQFASRGMSIVGDGKYGSHDNRARMPALFSSALSFDFENETLNIKELPDINSYPWSLFDWSNIK